jgi:hypothetical protein
MLLDCDDLLTGFHTCFAENAAWQRVAIIRKDRHYPGSMEARSFMSAMLANHSLLDTLEIILRQLGIDPQVFLFTIMLNLSSVSTRRHVPS